MNAFDRCDRCGAAAQVKVVIGGSDLLFCGHHFTENASKLVAYEIHDSRDAALENAL